MTTQIQVKAIHDLSCSVISLSRRFIDLHDDPDFFELITQELKNDCARFVVDLSEITHMNSTGINTIVKAVKFINENGGRIVFTQVPDHIAELLSIIKLNAILEIAPTVEDGIQTLNA